MDVKKWFENGTGLEIKELRYLAPPPLPYNIFIDSKIYDGADKNNNLIQHEISIEHYSNTINTTAEQTIDEFLNSQNIKFDKDRDWLDNDKLFITVYELEPIFEKVRKEK